MQEKKTTPDAHYLSLFLSLILGYLLAVPASAQLGINSTNAAADASAIVDISSTTKGFLPPRMTTDQRKAIASPAEGLVVYNTDHQSIEVYNGEVWTTNTGQFKCGNTQIKDTQGHRYETVLIGTQCWMAENLNSGNRINGSVDQSNNSIIEKYCFNDNDANCDEYGGLYQWNEMMQYVTTEGTQGICPTGWHLPTLTEWATLVAFLGGSTIAGGKMKETGTNHWLVQSIGTTNSSGFTALGAGYLYESTFYDLKGSCNIWTSKKEIIGDVAWYYSIWDSEDTIILDSGSYDLGFSVRCIQD